MNAKNVCGRRGGSEGGFEGKADARNGFSPRFGFCDLGVSGKSAESEEDEVDREGSTGLF